MAYSQTWLEDPTRARGLLVVATAYSAAATAEVPLYWSTMAFATTDGVVFNPIIANDVKITESISVDGSVSMSYGDIELQNPNGELDDYLDNSKWRWSNQRVKIYYGDPRWTVANIATLGDLVLENTFELVYDGIIDDCKSRNKSVVNIVLRDKLENLNVPVTEDTIGTVAGWTGQTNQDTIKPLIFGEVYNLSPVLVNPTTLTYRFNNGVCEGVTEIRDNGFPIWYTGDLTGATVDNSTGTFSLSRPAAGSITCSVQGIRTTWNISTNGVGASTWRYTVPDIIRLLVTAYGKTGKQFSTAEIDNASFKKVLDDSTAEPACGYAVLDRANLLQVVQELAASIGCQIYVNRKGILKLLRLGATSASVATIEDRDILRGSVSVNDRTPHIGAVKLGYCRNWTVQQNLATLIPDTSKADLSEEWLVKTVTDAQTLSDYKLSSDPVQKNTYLITTAAAQQEADRLLTYYKTQRTVYSLTCTSKHISLNLGDWITLKHNRFGLSSGKSAQIISISPQWCKGLVDLEVMV